MITSSTSLTCGLPEKWWQIFSGLTLKECLKTRAVEEIKTQFQDKLLPVLVTMTRLCKIWIGTKVLQAARKGSRNRNSVRLPGPSPTSWEREVLELPGKAAETNECREF